MKIDPCSPDQILHDIEAVRIDIPKMMPLLPRVIPGDRFMNACFAKLWYPLKKIRNARSICIRLNEVRFSTVITASSPIYSAFRPFRAAEEKAMGMDGSVRTHNPLEK